MTPSVLWFRRDLRLADHPALLAAAAGDRPVVPLFVIDPVLWDPAGPPRRAWLVRSLRELDARLGGRLVVRRGSPPEVVADLAREVAAGDVHVSADAGVYGRQRDEAVARALACHGRRLVATGSSYAIGPGRLRTGAGTPFQVFTPFLRAWLRHGWPAPAGHGAVQWADGLEGRAGGAGAGETDGGKLPAEPDLGELTLPAAGEQAALARWQEFLAGGLAGYAERRDLPGVAGTSAMSAHLKYGEIHPRTMLAALAGLEAEHPDAVARYRSELCWREFYADVLWHHPDSARQYLRGEYARLRYDDPATDPQARRRLAAWQDGRTGYPFVDAGMRQLRAQGWMHNRVRMVVASFLVKDLHLEWQHGARFFMHWLRDGDLASNSHGWQWTAGSGTDAAPYFRVFNPVGQGRKFDPDGQYVRRFVPELAHLDGGAAHEPWTRPDGYARGYPKRVVDHAAERTEALARYGALRQQSKLGAGEGGRG